MDYIPCFHVLINKFYLFLTKIIFIYTVENNYYCHLLLLENEFLLK